MDTPRTKPTPEAVEALARARCPKCDHLVRHHERYPYLDGVTCKTRVAKQWCACPHTHDYALLAAGYVKRDALEALADRWMKTIPHEGSGFYPEASAHDNALDIAYEACADDLREVLESGS